MAWKGTTSLYGVTNNWWQFGVAQVGLLQAKRWADRMCLLRIHLTIFDPLFSVSRCRHFKSSLTEHRESSWAYYQHPDFWGVLSSAANGHNASYICCWRQHEKEFSDPRQVSTDLRREFSVNRREVCHLSMPSCGDIWIRYVRSPVRIIWFELHNSLELSRGLL